MAPSTHRRRPDDSASGSQRLFLIDGTAFCYRAFYAVRELSTSKGQPTNAVFGVVSMLKRLLEENRPEAAAVTFDRPEPTFRHDRFKDYKAQRPPMPDGLQSQIPLIKRLFEGYRIPVFEKAGFEADDLLATLADRAVRSGREVFLVTGDKDLFQMLSPQVRLLRPGKAGMELITEATLHERWGIRPDQVVEVMALMGDATDGIPGVPGIGEKTAVELIRKFGSVDTLLKRLEEVPGTARREKIAQYREQLLMSRELAVIDRAVPIDVDWEALTVGEPDAEKLRALYQELEFKKLLSDLPAPKGEAVAASRIGSEREWAAVLTRIRRAGSAAISIAGSGPAAPAGRVTAVGFSWGRGAAAVRESAALKPIADLLTDPKVGKVFCRLKEGLIFCAGEGIEPRGELDEPTLASYLLNPSGRSHAIEDLALERLGGALQAEDPVDRAAEEAEAAGRLMPPLRSELKQQGLDRLYREIEIPLAGVLAGMERRGIAVDPKHLAVLSKEMERTLKTLTGRIEKLAGESFNINSPKQLAQVLFDKLKLPVIKRTKTGPSTNEEVLLRLAKKHPLPEAILEYRELAKLRSTYVEPLPKLVAPETGRIHASFNQAVAATGRLSASNPNLQNIPIRTEIGRQIRKAFIPSRSAWVILAADYSQIELRILAHLSGDTALVRAFESGEDIHRATAAEMFHVPAKQVTADQRAAAKTINFGIVYGMSAFGLSRELGIAPAEAQEFIDRYFKRYAGVAAYLKASLVSARKRGYCLTLLNRRRLIPELKSKNVNLRQFAERTAINAPIQGSAADMIKMAMVALDRRLRAEKLEAALLIQVHDELVFETPKKEVDRLTALVREVMAAPEVDGHRIALSVPVEVTVHTGPDWLEAHA
ncbi:MAG: DNA polymerase I [Candidatus Omnitrophica bacterium CG11_big_fil_rev_8_21_14_0_20_64_10]|nr:MAG: DNA polymerase I [Candidatus Omnitrophica bacterium CG11_big_fil_rev_8_21_14_0_20_64_10]